MRPLLCSSFALALGLSALLGGCRDSADPERLQGSETVQGLPPPLVDLQGSQSERSGPTPDDGGLGVLGPEDWVLPDAAQERGLPPWFRLFYIQDNRAEMNPCGCPGSPTGGLARRTTFVRDIRRLFPDALIAEGPTALSRASLGIETIVGSDRERGRFLLDLIAQSGAEAFFPGQADFEVVPWEAMIPRATKQGMSVVATNLAVESGPSGLKRSLIREIGGRRVLILGLVRSPEKEGMRGQVPLVDAPLAVGEEIRRASEEGPIDAVIAFTDADLRERKRWEEQGLDVDVLLLASERERELGEWWENGRFRVRSEPQGRAFRRIDLLLSGPEGQRGLVRGEGEALLRRASAMEELYLLRSREHASASAVAEGDTSPRGVALPPGLDGQARRDRSQDPKSLLGAMAAAKGTRKKALAGLLGLRQPGHLTVASRWTVREGLAPDPVIEAAIDEHQVSRMAAIEAAVLPQAQGTLVEGRFGGQDQCIDCHAPKLAGWARGPHARAWLHLKERGETRNPDCLPCHTTGFGQPGGFADPAADRSLLNVQCEACHGPMELHARKAARPGFRPPSGQPIGVATCERCHDAVNSPSFDCRTYLRRLPHPSLDENWEALADKLCGS